MDNFKYKAQVILEEHPATMTVMATVEDLSK